MIYTREDIQQIVTDSYISETWDLLNTDPRGKTLNSGQYEIAPYHRLIFHTLRSWSIGKFGYTIALQDLEQRVLEFHQDPTDVTSDILTRISEFFNIDLPIAGNSLEGKKENTQS